MIFPAGVLIDVGFRKVTNDFESSAGRSTGLIAPLGAGTGLDAGVFAAVAEF
jgi:hypothetical protein